MSAYSLRIPASLMREAKDMAKRSEVSLNQFFLTAIAERVGAEQTRELFSDLASRADPDEFQRILNRVPDIPALPGDELASGEKEPH
jgi:hypothetical protein|tara:strand:- start:502 stop:762 length:261 start_codon:yes stop_codon:yes gene_type:complete